MNNHEQLLSLYNELDELLRHYYHENNRNNSVIIRFCNDLNKAGSDNTRKMAKKLNSIRVLRNTLIHDLNMNAEHLMDITDETILFLEDVIDKIRNPKTALDIATPVGKLYLLNVNKEYFITDIMSEMRKKGFTQVPVVDNNNVIKGIFSPNALFAYLEVNKGVSIDKLTLKDIFPFLSINNHFSESYLFLKENLREDEVSEIFVESYEANKKVVMAFVNKSGNEKDPIKGIIVIRDLINNN